jgi:poly(A) polymerase
LPSRRAIFRFFRDLGDAAPACLLLALADGAGAAGPRLSQERWQRMCAYTSYLLDRGEELGQGPPIASRLLTGRDIIEALDVTPGPEVGRLLSAVEEAIGAGEVTTKDGALEMARRLVSK